MASINYGAREISVKIVYYGPGLSGKTTNLQVIHRKIPPEHKSDMVSLATETDRTLFFDFLPLDLGTIKGFSTKFQLYTVPGQVYYNATRKLVLRGVDGVVFVADSAADKIQENLESFQNLEDNLAEYHYKREEIPIIVQYNKRDLPNALSVEELHQLINRYNLPWTEAVANKGIGVFDSLKLIGKIVIDTLNKKYSRLSRGVATGPAPAGRPPQPTQAAAPAGYDTQYQSKVAPSIPPRQQYAGYSQQQAYGSAPAPTPSAPYRQSPAAPQPAFQSQPAKPQIPRPPISYGAPGQAPVRAPQEADYYQPPTAPQGESFPPPQQQGAYAASPEIPRPGAAAPDKATQQQYGFANFEPLPIEPSKSKAPSQARPLSYSQPPQSEKIQPQPTIDAENPLNAATFEKRGSSEVQPLPAAEQAPRDNEHAVVFPQKQQRPSRAQIDERDYSVYHIDSAQTSFPNSSSGLDDTALPAADETDARKKPGGQDGKQQRGFLSKFFNRDA